MHTNIIGEGANELFYKVCDRLINNPDFTITNRKGKVLRELINPCLILKDPLDRIISLKERKLSLFYLAGELLWYLSGSDKLSFISHYSNFWSLLDDGNGKANSCYGKKLLHDRNRNGLTQFDFAADQLCVNPETKKAVMVIYDKHSADLETKDLPCTMHLHFFIREGKLYLITYMRSNDVWFGLSYDLPFFTLIQEMMCVYLNEWGKLKDKDLYKNLSLGHYTHVDGSLHLYDRHYEQAKTLLENKETYPFTPIPLFTSETAKQLNILYEAEKLIRSGENIKYPHKYSYVYDKISNPFILRILKWITKEEVF